MGPNGQRLPGLHTQPRPSEPFRSSYLLRDADEVAAAWPELRREHADAACLPDLVDLVKHVDDVETNRHRHGIVG